MGLSEHWGTSCGQARLAGPGVETAQSSLDCSIVLFVYAFTNENTKFQMYPMPLAAFSRAEIHFPALCQHRTHQRWLRPNICHPLVFAGFSGQ